MGQSPGCCHKETDKDLGRKNVPVTLLNKILQPILKNDDNPVANPYCPQLYGQFHCRVSPIRYASIKMPAKNLQKTQFKWGNLQIWQYPIEKVHSLTQQQIRNRTFPEKHAWFKLKLEDERKKYESDGFNKLVVDPTNVLLSSYKNFDKINFNLQTKIKFEDDKGAIDAGGLFREWVNLSIIEAFSPDLGMFKLCETDETAYKIVVSKANFQVFVEIGRILGFVIGKSLIEKIPLNCYFNRTLYRILANQPIYLSDMYNYDIGIYNSLSSILQNPISEQDLLTFAVQVKDPFTDKLKMHELKANGKNIFVNEGNKKQFVSLMIKFYTYGQIRDIVQGMKYTLYQVIPYNFLEIFEPHQFEMILCGRPTIDVQDWKKNTYYKGYMPNDPIIEWFWQIVAQFDQQMRSNLLHFCTGSTKVPIQGFKYLESKRGHIKHFSIKQAQLNKDNPFPKGITCFNKLQLPPYTSKEELMSMLVAVCQQQIHDFGLDNIKH